MTDPRAQKPKLILPETEGIPNLEVRRMMRELETTKPPPKINPQTAKQISLHLDALQKLTQDSQVQGMVICALLLKGAHPKGEASTLFGVPNEDKSVARELLDYTHGWLLQCAEEIEKPPPESA